MYLSVAWCRKIIGINLHGKLIMQGWFAKPLIDMKTVFK